MLRPHRLFHCNVHILHCLSVLCPLFLYGVKVLSHQQLLIQFIIRSVLPNTVNSNTPSCSSVLTIINGSSPCKGIKNTCIRTRVRYLILRKK